VAVADTRCDFTIRKPSICDTVPVRKPNPTLRLRRACAPFATLGLILLSATLLAASSADAATEIERRIADHIEAAAAGGVQPTDFHHLVFAFYWRDTVPDPALVARGLDRLSASPRTDALMMDEIRTMRARLASEAGRPAAARELFRGMGGLSAWWVGDTLDLAELADFDDSAVLPTGGGWRPAAGTDPLGWVRLSGLAWPAQRQMVYLATTVESDRQRPVAVRVGAAQAARVWLDGSEVLTTAHPLERSEDQVSAGGWLRRGRNTLVVAVASESDDWWLRVRLTAPDGGSLEGVTEVSTAPEVRARERREPPTIRATESEIRSALRAGDEDASMALAAFLVLRRPHAVGAGEARTACRAARAVAPAEARILEWLMTTDQELVYELLRQAVDAEPGMTWARMELAAWFAERGLFEEASTVLEPVMDEPAARAVALDIDSELWGIVLLPEMVDLARRYPTCEAVGLAVTHRALDARRTDVARALLAPLEAEIPGAAAVVGLRERLAESCNDGETLRQIFSEGLDWDANDSELRLRLVRLESGLGDVDTARGRLAAGLERSPADVDLLMELARVEHAAGNDQAAEDLSRRVLALRPQDRRASRLVELISGETEDLSWLREPDELLRLAADAPAGDPAVTLLDHIAVHFLPSALIEEKVQQAFLVTSAERAESYRRRALPYIAESERLRVLRARVLRRDGSEVSARQSDTPRLAEPEFNLYYDTRLRVLDFPELEEGDVIEIAYVRTETIESNETGPYNGGLLSFGRPVPTMIAEAALVGSEDDLPSVELVNLEGEPARIELEEGRVRLAWSWRNLEPAPPDVPPAPPAFRGRFLAYSSHPEWGELASWYSRHVAPRIRVSRQIEDLAAQLTDGIEDRLERIARIYAYVTNEISYVGLEFGEHRFRPFSADWVLDHGIGDCKDKAALLVALYEAVGIPARMVMVRIAELGPAEAELAMLETFNHAIAYLPEDDLWLDGTASGHALLPPPAMDQGATVLVVDGETSTIEEIPRTGSGLDRTEFRLGAASNGLVPLQVRVEDRGAAADRRRGRFAGSRDPRPFASWLQRSFPGAELTAEPKLRLIPSRDPAVIELEATVPRTALESGGGIPTYPGAFEVAGRVVPSAKRAGPLLVEMRPDLEWLLEVHLGRPAVNLPDDVNLTSDFGSLKIEFGLTEDGYLIEGYFHLASGLVAAESTPDLRNFLLEVDRILARPVEAP
jgi:transglutaminase-like putative cysteine protease